MDNIDKIRDKIQKTLMCDTKNKPEGMTVAIATLQTWHQVSIQLAPIIGEQGVNALFSRSLHLTAIVFPWLAVAEGEKDTANGLNIIRACIVNQEPSIAAEASYLLIMIFTELLETLIGKSLTKRLLYPIWTPLPPLSDKEPES